MESWLAMPCLHCNAKNWLNQGNLDDCTVPDIEACKCWKCEKKFFLDPDNVRGCFSNIVAEWDNNSDPPYEYATGEEFLQNMAFCAWGRQNPNDPYRTCD